MPLDKAGNPRSGHSRAAYADKVHGGSEHSDKPDAKKAMDKPKAGGAEKGASDVSHMDIGEVVKKHGPAHAIQSNHKDGLHTVTSHHGAHMHHSEHSSPEESNKHHGKALGLDAALDDPYAEESPEGEMAETNVSGGGIPGMS